MTYYFISFIFYKKMLYLYAFYGNLIMNRYRYGVEMFKKFIPDYFFNDIYEIPKGFFTKLGIKAVICDIDNTLVTYDDKHPTEELLSFLKTLSDEGIKVAFVSNNNKERVNLFNSTLKYHAFSNSRKPSRRALVSAMRAMGSNTKNTAMLGDQIFTDVFSGKRLGLLCVLVKPIKDKKNLFFKTKRLLEKPFLNMYHKNNNISGGKDV